MTREEFLFDISDLPKDGYKTLHKILSDYDADNRQIVDEQVEESRGLRRDVLLMQKANAEQRALIEQQAKEIERVTERAKSYHDLAENQKNDSEKQAQKIARLVKAMTLAREKLVLYRSQHSGEYVGGMEFGSLLEEIDCALKIKEEHP